MKRTIVFLPRNKRTWSELSGLAGDLSSTGRFAPVMILANADMHEMADICRVKGLAFRLVELDSQSPSAGTGPKDLLGSLGIYRNNRWSDSLIVGLYRMVRTRQALVRLRRQMEIILWEISPIALIVGGDRELSPIPEGLSAARRGGIPTIVWSSTLAADVEALLPVRRGKIKHMVSGSLTSPILNRIAARILPGQSWADGDTRFLFSPGWLTLALHAANMLPENPWCIGGGMSDIVCLYDRRQFKAFTEMGIDPKKLKLVGDLTRDTLNANYMRQKELRCSIARSFGLDPFRPIAVFGVPSLWEQELLDWQTHRQKVEETISALRDVGWLQVVANLHPRSEHDRYRFLTDELGVPIWKDKLVDCLPACDLYISTHSSTFEWACLLGVPSIDYDYIGFGAGVIDDPRVRIAFDTEAVRRFAADTLANRPCRGDNIEGDIVAADDPSGTFDGRCAQRLLSLLEELSPAGCKGSMAIAAPC